MHETASKPRYAQHGRWNLTLTARDVRFDEKNRQTGYFLLCPKRFVEDETSERIEISECAHFHGKQPCRCVHFKGFSATREAAGKLDGTEIESYDLFPVVECAFRRFKDESQRIRYLQKSADATGPKAAVPEETDTLKRAIEECLGCDEPVYPNTIE